MKARSAANSECVLKTDCCRSGFCGELTHSTHCGLMTFATPMAGAASLPRLAECPASGSSVMVACRSIIGPRVTLSVMIAAEGESQGQGRD
jgi:hypothetical protein